jgi:hypothetical protein
MTMILHHVPTMQVRIWAWYCLMSYQHGQFFETRTSLQTTVSAWYPTPHWSTKGFLHLEEKKHEGRIEKRAWKGMNLTQKTLCQDSKHLLYMCVCVCFFMRDLLDNYLLITLGTLLDQIPSQSNNSQKQTKFLVLITFSNKF